MYALTADFGSTYTKLSAIDLNGKKILATSRAFTTIETHVLDGFYNALNILEQKTGKLDYAHKIASSSAAGGLKMVAVGLVPSLTANAAKLAANSAGAKVIKTFSYELSENEINEIYEINPDIIMLSGGIDGGNKDVIIANANALASIEQNFSVIVAGNKSASSECTKILKSSGKNVITVSNVMPNFNELDIMPAKNAIRNLFIERIIDAKGLSEAQAIMDTDIIPTPLACFIACERLEEKIGSLMAVDVGGATTDVYSMDFGYPTNAQAVLKGLKEPFAKRSVEGDLGVRYSIESLVSECGIDEVAYNIKCKPDEVKSWVKKCVADPEVLPENESFQKKIDNELAASCVEIAVKRHVGFCESAYTVNGEMLIQTGKDLSDIKYVLGTGGSLINGLDPYYILGKAVYENKDLQSLKPKKPKLLIDKSYIMSAMGLLSAVNADIATDILISQLEI